MESNTAYLEYLEEKIKKSDNYLYNKSLPENKEKFELIENMTVEDFSDDKNIFQKILGNMHLINND